MCQHLASLHGYGPVLDALGRKIDPAALAALTSGYRGREGIIDNVRRLETLQLLLLGTLRRVGWEGFSVPCVLQEQTPDILQITADFSHVKVGQHFLPLHLSKSVVETETESFSLSASRRNPGRLPHPPCLSPGLCLGTQKGLSQSKVIAMVSPPSQLTTVLLKEIILMFLIPEAPGIQRNTLCVKGSDFSRVQPYRFHPSCARDLCASLCWLPGSTTAKSTYTSDVFDPGRKNSLDKREEGETRM